VRVEDRQWQGPFPEDFIVKRPDIELRAQPLLGERAQLADLELADLITQRLAGSRHIPLDLRDLLFGSPTLLLGAVAQSLLATPALGVQAGVHDESHRAVHVAQKHAKILVGVGIQAEFPADALAIQAQPSAEALLAS
jgi:hypothetical protein